MSQRDFFYSDHKYKLKVILTDEKHPTYFYFNDPSELLNIHFISQYKNDKNYNEGFQFFYIEKKEFKVSFKGYNNVLTIGQIEGEAITDGKIV